MSENDLTAPPGMDLDENRITFDLIKGNFFRVVAADGIFGGVGPRGQLRMAFFSERWPIPKRIVCELSNDGEAKDEVRSLRESRDAVVREVEVEVVMDFSTAKNVADWMQNVLTQVEQREREQATETDD
ncbi:MAG: hypothetical protein R6V85_14415 [Polyangia bacterium]